MGESVPVGLEKARGHQTRKTCTVRYIDREKGRSDQKKQKQNIPQQKLAHKQQGKETYN
jgi:hypothetical protein